MPTTSNSPTDTALRHDFQQMNTQHQNFELDHFELERKKEQNKAIMLLK